MRNTQIYKYTINQLINYIIKQCTEFYLGFKKKSFQKFYKLHLLKMNQYLHATFVYTDLVRYSQLVQLSI